MFLEGEEVEVTFTECDRPLKATIQRANDRFLVLDFQKEQALPAEGMRICLRVATQQGIYLMETSVLKRGTEAVVVPWERPLLQQRRKGERLPCDLLGCYLQNASIEEMEAAREGPVEMAHIINISQGGACLLTNKPLFNGASLCLCIELENGELLMGEAVVVRCRLAKKPNLLRGLYEVGVHFLNIPRFHQVRLVRLLQILREKAA